MLFTQSLKFRNLFFLLICFLYCSASRAQTVKWYPVPKPKQDIKPVKILLPASYDINSAGGFTIRNLFDYGTRDPHILHAPDGYFYMVATAAANTLPKPLKSRPDANFWHYNDGIPLWRSKNLKDWETMGYVWTFEKDATWAKQYKFSPHTKTEKNEKVRAIWAPEIHFIKGNYWIPYSMNYDGIGILKSTTGKPEGPYVDIIQDKPLPGDIDATLFEDTDGSVYYLFGGYQIAKMKSDLSGLAEEPRKLKFVPDAPWGEGINMNKINGKYVWINASNPESFLNGKPVRTYDSFSATSDFIYGPYTNRYRAIPYAGHNNIFKDNEGNWWSTLFHPQPFMQRNLAPAIVPLNIDTNGIISIKRTFPRPEWLYSLKKPKGSFPGGSFRNRHWEKGKAGFGNPQITQSGAYMDVATVWKGENIWLRRKFILKEETNNPALFFKYTGKAEIYINGREVYTGTQNPENYITVPLKGVSLLRRKNIIAVKITNSPELAYFDLGIIEHN